MAALLCGFVVLPANAAGEPSSRKQELIRQAMTSMKLDLKIQSLIDQRVEGRAQRLRADNPGLSDTAAARVLEKARGVIREVYAAHRFGRDGLDARVVAVFDRHLTEEDLKFVHDFRASDNGKRYREVAPRIVEECVDAGLRWAEKLEPEIRRRLETEFRSEKLKI